MTTCAIAYETDQYLARQEDTDARYEAHVKAHISEVCSGGKYDPLDKDNFSEALSDEISTIGDCISPLLLAFVKTGNAEGLREALRNHSVKYWVKYAENKAENDW